MLDAAAELFTRSAGNLLDHWFETDAVKALFGFDSLDARVASLFCQHFAYNLSDGRDWRQEKSRAIDLIFDVIEEYAPGCRARGRSLGAEPARSRRKLGLAGSDIFHGALGLDQLWAARPMLGYGDCRTPLKNLYLCGSGGQDAACEILRDGLSTRVST